MKKMRIRCWISATAFLVLLLACTAGGKKEENPADLLYARFDSRPAWDTLHFSIDEPFAGRPISDTLVWRCFDKATFDYLHFDTGKPQFSAGSRYALNDSVAICLLNNEEAWFKKQILLLFDTQKHRFFSVREVANFYGGEGGQILLESWLFRNAGNTPNMYMKKTEHWLVPGQDDSEPTEHLVEAGNLLRWEKMDWVPADGPDSLVLKKHFKSLHEW